MFAAICLASSIACLLAVVLLIRSYLREDAYYWDNAGEVTPSLPSWYNRAGWITTSSGSAVARWFTIESPRGTSVSYTFSGRMRGWVSSQGPNHLVDGMIADGARGGLGVYVVSKSRSMALNAKMYTREVAIHLLWPAGLFAILPAWWLRRTIIDLRHQRRMRPNHCHHCGYDLRVQLDASDRAIPVCPECGTAATSESTGASGNRNQRESLAAVPTSSRHPPGPRTPTRVQL